MIIWVNGAFGSGKTTVAKDIVSRDERFRLFDPESVGQMLQSTLAGMEIDDFQTLPQWRTLVPIVARGVIELTDQSLVIPGSVVNRAYWTELLSGFSREGIRTFHVVLDADRDVLADRIRNDKNKASKKWRIDHLGSFENARDWMRAEGDLVVDSNATDPQVLAGVVLSAVYARESVQRY